MCVRLLVRPASDLDRPKSPTLTRPSASRKQLDGFTSRWMTPSAVGLAQPVDHVEDRGRRPRPAAAGPARLDQVLERVAGHQLHDDVRPAGVLVGGEHEHAARVGEAGWPAGPPGGTARHGAGRVGVARRREQLDGDAAAGAGVLGLVDACPCRRPRAAAAAGSRRRPRAPGRRRRGTARRTGPRRSRSRWTCRGAGRRRRSSASARRTTAECGGNGGRRQACEGTLYPPRPRAPASVRAQALGRAVAARPRSHVGSGFDEALPIVGRNGRPRHGVVVPEGELDDRGEAGHSRRALAPASPIRLHVSRRNLRLPRNGEAAKAVAPASPMSWNSSRRNVAPARFRAAANVCRASVPDALGRPGRFAPAVVVAGQVEMGEVAEVRRTRQGDRSRVPDATLGQVQFNQIRGVRGRGQGRGPGVAAPTLRQVEFAQRAEPRRRGQSGGFIGRVRARAVGAEEGDGQFAAEFVGDGQERGRRLAPHLLGDAAAEVGLDPLPVGPRPEPFAPAGVRAVRARGGRAARSNCGRGPPGRGRTRPGPRRRGLRGSRRRRSGGRRRRDWPGSPRVRLVRPRRPARCIRPCRSTLVGDPRLGRERNGVRVGRRGSGRGERPPRRHG